MLPLITHPYPFQVQQRHKRLILSGRILVSRLKRSPVPLGLGFQKWLLDEEGNATTRGGIAGQQHRPLPRSGRTEAQRVPLTVLQHPNTHGDWVLLCKRSCQVQICLTPVCIHETSPHSLVIDCQVIKFSPNPSNLPPGYNHPGRRQGSSQGRIFSHPLHPAVGQRLADSSQKALVINSPLLQRQCLPICFIQPSPSVLSTENSTSPI